MAVFDEEVLSLEAFLKVNGIDDEAIFSYISDLIGCETTDGEEGLEQLVEMVSDFLPFENQSVTSNHFTQLHQIREVILQHQSEKTKENIEQKPSDPTPKQKENPTANVKKTANTETTTSKAKGNEVQPNSKQSAIFEFLNEIVPSLSSSAIEYAFLKNLRNKDDTVAYLLDTPPKIIEEESAIYHEKMSIRKLEKENDKKRLQARNRVLERFADQEIPDLVVPKKQHLEDLVDDGCHYFYDQRKIIQRQQQTNTREKKSNAGATDSSNIRYRGNEIVSRKGEKYMPTEKKEEWDGGSRGRVKTKGKRGPGFV